MNTYFLLHENFKVAIFTVKNNSVLNLKINDNNESQLPVGIFTEKQLIEWINHRGIPVTRQGLAKDLNITSFEYMLENLGLSLTDHYWICDIDNLVDWKDVNLYANDFKVHYSLNLRDDKNIVSRTNFVPSASLKGDLKKKWIIDNNGVRRLVKGNYNNSCRQSICEVLASEIHRRQNKFSYVPYSLVSIKSDNNIIVGCECPNFTSIQTEFVSAIDIIANLKKPNELSYYEFFIEICKRNGLDIRNFLEYQILTDFIITNTDRHLNNFGIIRDSQTLKWISYAPIFDSGNSMFYDFYYIPVDKGLLNIEVSSFLKKEVQLLKYVKNRGLIDVSLLPKDSEVYDLLKKDITIKDEINERIIRAYNKKIKYLIDFQNGANIWSYNYKG